MRAGATVRCCFATFAILLVAAAPALAASPWTPPRAITPPGELEGLLAGPVYMDAAFGPGGTGLAVWPRTQGTRRAEAAPYAAGAFGPGRTLFDPSSGQTPPHVAIAGTGRVFVVNDGVTLSTGATPATLDGGQVIGAGRSPDVAANASGQAVIAWVGESSQSQAVVVVFRSADGTLSDPQRFEPPPPPQPGIPQGIGAPVVGIDDAGRAAVIWFQFGSSSKVFLARSSAAGTFGEPERIDTLFSDDPRAEPEGSLDMQQSRTGEFVATWQGRQVKLSGGRGVARHGAAALLFRGTGPVTAQGVFPAFVPRLGLGPDGTAILVGDGAAVTKADGTGVQGAIVAVRKPGRTFGKARLILQHPFLPDNFNSGGAAVDAHGNGLIAFSSFVTRQGHRRRELRAFRWVHGRFCKPETLSRARFPFGPLVGIDSAGRSVVLWATEYRGGNQSRIETSTRRKPLTSPRCAPLRTLDASGGGRSGGR